MSQPRLLLQSRWPGSVPYRDRLRAAGYDVDRVETGYDALVRAVAEPYELIIMDARTDAFERLTLRLALGRDERTHGIPMMTLGTASVDASPRVAALAECEAEICAEPWVDDALLSAVERALGHHDGASRPARAAAG